MEELKMKNKTSKIQNFLNEATARQLYTFIELMEQEKSFKNCEFKASIKHLFVVMAFEKLKVKKYVINNRRQKIKLDIEDAPSSIYFCANTKAWENKDALYEKVYEMYKETLFQLLERHDLEIKAEIAEQTVLIKSTFKLQKSDMPQLQEVM
jgi:hypothetical protein